MKLTTTYKVIHTVVWKIERVRHFLRPLQVTLLFLVPRPHAFGDFQIISILSGLYTACVKLPACKYLMTEISISGKSD